LTWSSAATDAQAARALLLLSQQSTLATHPSSAQEDARAQRLTPASPDDALQTKPSRLEQPWLSSQGHWATESGQVRQSESQHTWSPSEQSPAGHGQFSPPPALLQASFTHA